MFGGGNDKLSCCRVNFGLAREGDKGDKVAFNMMFEYQCWAEFFQFFARSGMHFDEYNATWFIHLFLWQ